MFILFLILIQSRNYGIYKFLLREIEFFLNKIPQKMVFNKINCSKHKIHQNGA